MYTPEVTDLGGGEGGYGYTQKKIGRFLRWVFIGRFS